MCALSGWLGPCRGWKLSSAVEDTKYPSSCPACPSPGPVPLGNSEHNAQLCYLSVRLERIGPLPGWGEQCPAEQGLKDGGLGQLWDSCRLRSSRLVATCPPQLRLNIRALRVSEKFLASARPGLAGLKRLPSGNWGCCLPLAGSSCSSLQGFKLIGRFIQALRVGAQALGTGQAKGGRGRDGTDRMSERETE